MPEIDSYSNVAPKDGDQFVFARGTNTYNAVWEKIKEGVTSDLRFESFPSLGQDQDSTGSGVYYSGYRAYIGLIPLESAGAKEFIIGRMLGARSSYAQGGEIKFYAENDPYNNGTDPSFASAYVRSTKGEDGARLVEFDYNYDRWVGLEVKAGGSTISQNVRFVGHTISESGSDFPVQLGTSEPSNLAVFSGNQDNEAPGEIHEELSTKTIFADLGVGKDPSYQVHSAGDVAADGTVRDLSDARVKETIEPITEPLKRARELGGHTYDRTDKDRHSAGLVAQDVEEVFPVAVDESGDLKTLDQGALLGLAFSAINALQQENDELRSRLNKVEQQL